MDTVGPVAAGPVTKSQWTVEATINMIIKQSIRAICAHFVQLEELVREKKLLRPPLPSIQALRVFCMPEEGAQKSVDMDKTGGCAERSQQAVAPCGSTGSKHTIYTSTTLQEFYGFPLLSPWY